MYQNAIYIAYIKSVFLDIAKFSDFRWKNVDVSRTQGVCHVILICFGSSLGNVNCAKFHHCRICVTNFREGRKSSEQPRKSPSWIGIKTKEIPKKHFFLKIWQHSQENTCARGVLIPDTRGELTFLTIERSKWLIFVP